MDDRAVILGVLAGVLVIVVTSALFVTGPVESGAGNEPPRSPALLAFETGSAQCADTVSANSSTAITTDGSNARVTYARNVSLPGPTEAVGDPAFQRRNETAYELSIPTGRTQRAPRNCSGVARFEATMRIPAGDDPWRIVVQHDNETVTTIEGDADSTGVSGSASGGQRVNP
jgi:hypothetical protein